MKINLEQLQYPVMADSPDVNARMLHHVSAVPDARQQVLPPLRNASVVQVQNCLLRH